MQSAIRCNRVRLRTNLLDFKVLLLLGTNHVRTLHRGIIGAKWGESSLEVCKKWRGICRLHNRVWFYYIPLHSKIMQCAWDAYADQRLRGGIPASASALNLPPFFFFFFSLFVLLRLFSFRTRKPLAERMITQHPPQSKDKEHLIRFGKV